MKQITYLCGGINNLNDSECNDWRAQAKEWLETDTLDPMRRDYRGREMDPQIFTEIVDQDVKDIDNCHYLLVNASRPSWGTAMEVVYAFFKKKIIVAFLSGGRASPWLVYHCTDVLDDLGEAVGYINEYALDRGGSGEGVA